MVNEIKLDGISSALQANKTAKDRQVSQTGPVSHEQMKVSSQLSSMVNTALADNSQLTASQKVAELKEKINSNQYRVDLDKLADKLAHSILGTK
jgi:anti-sigma28 factor (negative regulator of flagellin synthesis)